VAVGPVLAGVAVVLGVAAYLLVLRDDGSPAEVGELVSSEPVDLVDDVPGTRIRYGSIDVDGHPTEMTGLVATPAGTPPEGGWPIAVWGHSTTGVGDHCAPSSNPAWAFVGPTLVRLAAEGFLAVAPDYEGIGTDDGHPYLHGPSEARAVVDAVRAARQLVGPGEASTRWAVLGHSQGGHAAAFVAELGPGLAPELDLVGAAAFALVADPAALVPFPTSLVLLAAGYLETDGATGMEDLLTAEGRVAVRAAGDTGCAVSGPPLDAVLLAEPDDPGFRAYVTDNALALRPAAAPVLVLQGDADLLTTPERTAEAVARWCALGGAPIDQRVYTGADHGSIVDAAWADAVAWVRDRFAGAPVASSACA
jgi:pimeloyl-ACP methyl ester carboxylesterase